MCVCVCVCVCERACEFVSISVHVSMYMIVITKKVLYLPVHFTYDVSIHNYQNDHYDE